METISRSQNKTMSNFANITMHDHLFDSLTGLSLMVLLVTNWIEITCYLHKTKLLLTLYPSKWFAMISDEPKHEDWSVVDDPRESSPTSSRATDTTKPSKTRYSSCLFFLRAGSTLALTLIPISVALRRYTERRFWEISCRQQTRRFLRIVRAYEHLMEDTSLEDWYHRSLNPRVFPYARFSLLCTLVWLVIYLQVVRRKRAPLPNPFRRGSTEKWIPHLRAYMIQHWDGILAVVFLLVATILTNDVLEWIKVRTMECDPFCILGVHPTLDPKVIKKAYRMKNLQYHPDKNACPWHY